MRLDDICEYCGVAMDEHDHQTLARDCYPERIRKLQAEGADLARAVGQFKAEIARLQAENERLRARVAELEESRAH